MNVTVLARLRLYWLLFLLIPTAPSFAQSSPSTNNATCKIDQTPSTPIELAFYRDDYKKTAELAAADLKADPKNQRSRQLEIDRLIGMGQLDVARKKTDAWTAAEPTNPVAIVTAGELRHVEGDWLESYALMLK